jgi:ABC-2 type transport system permease protein
LADFWKLIQNENMKIYRRVRSWIMFGFIIFLPPIISMLINFAGPGLEITGWEAMQTESLLLFILITIFTVVIAAEAVAGEFTWGTIKLLLIRPWSRSAILLSKYLSTLLFALLLTVTAFAVSLLVNLAIFGLADAPGTESSPIADMGMYYVLKFISLIVVVTFGFMLSSVFRSSGLAIGLSIFLLLSGNIIIGVLSMVDKAWVKYVLFMHLDLSSYIHGGQGMIPSHPTTLGFSLSVLAAYFILFNLISWTVFRKRDISA